METNLQLIMLNLYEITNTGPLDINVRENMS